MKYNKLLGVLFVALGLAGCSEEADDAGSTEGASTATVEDESDFVVLDRMGRPEMTNVTFGPGVEAMKKALEKGGLKPLAPESERLAAERKIESNLNAEFRAYNKQNVFHPGPGDRDHALRLLREGIMVLDSAKRLPTLDLGDIRVSSPEELANTNDSLLGRVLESVKNAVSVTIDPMDWTPKDIGIITDILAEDALIVDISKKCDKNTASFMDIEREIYLARGGTTTDAKVSATHTTCGGRTFNDDIVDDVLTMWVSKSFDFSKSNPRRVSDGIDKPDLDDAEYTSTFPYVGKPIKLTNGHFVLR